MTEYFVAYSSRWKLALLVLAGAGFVVCGMWMMGVVGEPSQKMKAASEFSFAMGLLCLVRSNNPLV